MSQQGTSKETLSFKDAHCILDELTELYKTDKVQKKLQSLEKLSEQEATKEREAFLLELQIPIVKQYGFDASAQGVQDAMVTFSQDYLLYDADLYKKNAGLDALLKAGQPLDEYDPQWKMLAIRDCGYLRELPDWKYPVVEILEKKRDIEANMIWVPRQDFLSPQMTDDLVKACKAGDVAKASSLLGAKRVGAGAKDILINLGYRGLGPAPIPTLAKAFSKDAETLEIDISGNDIGLEGAKALASGIPQKLKVLKMNLANNRIPTAGVKALMAAIPKTVEILALGFAGMKMGTEGAMAIAKATPPNLKEHTLDIYGNDVKDDGVVAISQSLPKTLEYLNVMLFGNSISRRGFMVFDRQIDNPLNEHHLPKLEMPCFKKTGDVELCEFKEAEDGTLFRQVDFKKNF
jgi:hypothetical protein